MKIIKNKLIPFGDFVAMATWPFIFAKKDLSDVELRHEKIHGEQQKELLLIGFYLLYGASWVVELFRCAFNKNRGIDGIYRPKGYFDRVYKANPFEMEAYRGQWSEDYLDERKPFAWLRWCK